MDKTIFLIYGGKKSWAVPKKLFTSVIFDLLNQGSLQLIDRRLYLRASAEQSGHGLNRAISRHYVIVPNVTIPNATFPKVIKIPNINRNPAIPPRLAPNLKGAKLSDGERD
jgi:hypothetical protein